MESSSQSKPVDSLAVIRAFTLIHRDKLVPWEAYENVRRKFPKAVPARGNLPPTKNSMGLPEFIRTASPNTPWDKIADDLWERVAEALNPGVDETSQTHGYQVLETILGWSREGKRVYHVDHDLYRVLRVTSPSTHTWRDLRPPLRSFALQLPKPLAMPGHNESPAQVSTILVSFKDESEHRILGLGNTIRVSVISDTICGDEPVSEALSRELLRRTAQCTPAQVATLANEMRVYANRLVKPVERSSWHIDSLLLAGNTLDLPIRTDAASLLAAWRELTIACRDTKALFENTPRLAFWSEVLALIANFLIFLESAHHATYGSSGAQATKRIPTKAHDPVSGAERLELKHTFTLTDEERTVLDRVIGATDRTAVLELGTHFRAAHWRRPPGKGHDLEAAKTVHVKWTIVNLEKLLAGEIPAPRVARVTTSAR